MTIKISVGIALAVALVWTVFAQQTPPSAEAIDKAVSHCIDVVHHAGLTEGYDAEQFYLKFDAFYNSATGNIQNNADRAGDYKPLFVSDKCMAQQGFSLK